jgi:hypothetical protein
MEKILKREMLNRMNFRALDSSKQRIKAEIEENNNNLSEFNQISNIIQRKLQSWKDIKFQDVKKR